MRSTGSTTSSRLHSHVSAASHLRPERALSPPNAPFLHPPPSSHSLTAPPFRPAGPTRSVFLDKADGRVGVTCRNCGRGAGIEVCALEPGSLALSQGVRVGDVLLSVNGELARSHDHAVRLIDASPRLSLVLEAGTREVTLDKRDGDVGLTVGDALDGGSGVVVIGVQPGGLAILNGVSLGTVVLSVNGVLVEDHAHAMELVDASPPELALVLANEVLTDADVMRVLDHASSSSLAGFGAAFGLGFARLRRPSGSSDGSGSNSRRDSYLVATGN